MFDALQLQTGPPYQLAKTPILVVYHFARLKKHVTIRERKKGGVGERE
jgi:hypothetical protein